MIIADGKRLETEKIMGKKERLQALSGARAILMQCRDAGGDAALLERVWCATNEEFWALLEEVR